MPVPTLRRLAPPVRRRVPAATCRPATRSAAPATHRAPGLQLPAHALKRVSRQSARLCGCSTILSLLHVNPLTLPLRLACFLCCSRLLQGPAQLHCTQCCSIQLLPASDKRQHVHHSMLERILWQRANRLWPRRQLAGAHRQLQRPECVPLMQRPRHAGCTCSMPGCMCVPEPNKHAAIACVLQAVSP